MDGKGKKRKSAGRDSQAEKGNRMKTASLGWTFSQQHNNPPLPVIDHALLYIVNRNS